MLDHVPGGMAGSMLVPVLPSPEPEAGSGCSGDSCGMSEHGKGWCVGPLPTPGARGESQITPLPFTATKTASQRQDSTTRPGPRGWGRGQGKTQGPFPRVLCSLVVHLTALFKPQLCPKETPVRSKMDTDSFGRNQAAMSTSRPEPGARPPRSPCLQPLSRSSSSLLGEGQGQRPELRKSASSTVWQARPSEASGNPQGLEEEEQHAESVEQALASSPRPRPRAVGHWRSCTVGNVSAVGGGDLCRLRAPGATAMQRSHSDLVRSTQARGHAAPQKASLSCSALGSSPVHRARLQSSRTSGQGGQAPASLERDLAPEEGSSNSAWTLGESQVRVTPPDLGGTAPHSSSPQAGPKATGQPATASCHALSPAALLCGMREVGTSGCCHALPAPGILAFPKLVASVSESGLQAQHGVKFQCRLPGGLPGHSHCCAHHPWGPTGLATEPGARTKDVWTMTSASDLAPVLASSLSAQDAGVQAAPMVVCKAVATSPPLEGPVALHTFPEVTLGAGLEEAPSPVRDVRWDAEGMTWEVYGAAVDPEVLGVAIQKHLEMQFEQLQRAPTSEDSLSAEGRRGPLRAVMQSLRRPSCCGCSGAAPE